jgi:hypothetical protein
MNGLEQLPAELVHLLGVEGWIGCDGLIDRLFFCSQQSTLNFTIAAHLISCASFLHEAFSTVLGP